MGFFITNIDSVTGRGAHLFTDKTTFLLNTQGVFAVREDANSNSSFKYGINMFDDRAGIVRIESQRKLWEISNYLEDDMPNIFIALSVYKESNSNSDTENILYNANNICLAYDVEAGAIVYLRQGTMLDRIMVSENIADILNAISGTTSTTTSTTSTTSTSSSTSTTSTTSTTPAGLFIVDAEIGSVAANYLRLTFSEELTVGIDGNEDEFIMTINGGDPVSESGASTGNPYTIFMDEPVDPGDVVLVSYQGTHWGTETESLIYFSDFPVTNNSHYSVNDILVAKYTMYNNKIYIKFGLNPLTYVYISGSADYTPEISDFSISGIAGNPSITDIAILEQEEYSELQITLDTYIQETDSPLLTYTRGSKPLRDLYQYLINEWTDFVCTSFYPSSNYDVWDVYYTNGGSPNNYIVIKFSDDGDTYPTGSPDTLYQSAPPSSLFTFTGFDVTPNIIDVTVFSTYVRLTFDSDPTATNPTATYTPEIYSIRDSNLSAIKGFSNYSMRLDN